MSPSYARRSERRRKSRLRLFVTCLQIAILLGISSSVGVGLAMFVSLSPLLSQMQDVEAPEATIIYSSDRTILARIFREDRTNVPLKDIPENLRNATVAIEDKRFYKHSGVDMRGIARAIWGIIRQDRTRGGGSTITQQLARNVYLTRRKTVERKAQEAVLAIMLERNYTKDRILELYLNQVYYGSGAFGVQAASKVYFGKDVDDLNLSECAILAGLPQKPSGYSPHDNPKAAFGRRDTVLAYMADQGFITAQQQEQATAEKTHIVPKVRGRNTYKAPHFVDYVMSQLRKQYDDDVLFSGGLRVYTTLNYDMQKAAEEALRSGVRKFERSRKVTEGCFVAIEPATGYVRAMVGSVNPSSFFNRCTQSRRQPGSAFKAFVYTAAFEEGGMTPRSSVDGHRRSYPGANGKSWTPQNYDGGHYYSMPIKSAIANSVNTCAIYTTNKVGVQKVIKYAQLMGITAELEPYLPIAIGGIKGVYPIEMASAYCTFANEGVHVPPVAIVRIANVHGDTIQDTIPEGQQVISKKTCQMMDECLRAVVTSGTGRPASSVSQARGKTGTTNEDRDAWWIGYVPGKLVAACWLGNDNNAPMQNAYGSTVCVPIWRQFMQKALPIFDRIHAEAEAPPKKPVRKETPHRDRQAQNDDGGADDRDVALADERRALRICNDTDLLATSACPSTRIQGFSPGDEPSSYCTVHGAGSASRETHDRPAVAPNPPEQASTEQLVTVPVCTDSGMLAGPNCPKVMKKLPQDQLPTEVCTVHRRR